MVHSIQTSICAIPLFMLLLQFYICPNSYMVLILDGSSGRGAHIWSKSSISICWRHLVSSKQSLNLIFSEKTYTSCATWSEKFRLSKKDNFYGRKWQKISRYHKRKNVWCKVEIILMNGSLRDFSENESIPLRLFHSCAEGFEQPSYWVNTRVCPFSSVLWMGANLFTIQHLLWILVRPKDPRPAMFFVFFRGMT